MLQELKHKVVAFRKEKEEKENNLEVKTKFQNIKQNRYVRKHSKGHRRKKMRKNKQMKYK